MIRKNLREKTKATYVTWLQGTKASHRIARFIYQIHGKRLAVLRGQLRRKLKNTMINYLRGLGLGTPAPVLKAVQVRPARGRPMLIAPQKFINHPRLVSSLQKYIFIKIG